MNKNLFIATLCGLAALSANAAPLSPEAALKMATESAGRKIKGIDSPRLLDTRYDSEGNPALYLYTFSGNEGFMLLSASDAVPVMLGYSESNNFDFKAISPETEFLVDGYVAQIQDAEKAGLLPYRSMQTRADDLAPVAPMLSTSWDQTNPYNLLCPVSNGMNAVTGCVATAMAQVMMYWQYPSSGTGSISYTCKSLGQNLSMDFSSTTFDWGNMQNRYSRGNYSSTAAKAVGTLMKACGYSVKMEYGLGSSAANSNNIPSALTGYFGYDRGVGSQERRDYRSQEEWNSMVYNDLVNVGPVIYCGQSKSVGHCFVCDGYDGNGMFHINWGWGGISDGYFQLNELNPLDYGTGGGDDHYSGYNLLQSVVTGIMPPVGRLTLENMEIGNAADDSGNVKEWGGYTYRIMDFSHLMLTLDLRVSGGHISSPLYVTVYEYDPSSKKNGAVVLETLFDDKLNLSEGRGTYTTYVDMGAKYDPSKVYTLIVAYDLKGQRTTIGSLRFAASSGVDEIIGDAATLSITEGNGCLSASGAANISLRLFDLGGRLVAAASGENPSISTLSLPGGVYIARATAQNGAERVIKLHLR